MTTTTVLSDDTATIVREDVGRFNWGSVLAGAVIATAVTFFLISLGSGLGLALVSAHAATTPGVKTFLTLGAIFFVAANAFGFALGGHVTGRLMGPGADDSEEETFRADAHGLAVWGLGVVFGALLLALTVGSGATAAASSRAASVPASYWTDKLFRPATQQSSIAYKQYAQNPGQIATDAPTSAPTTPPAEVTPPASAMDRSGAAPDPTNSPAINSTGSTPTLADAKSEASRILAVDTAAGTSSDSGDTQQLARLVSQNTGLTSSAAADRVTAVENDMRTKAREAADAARRTTSYLSIWTALALLFSGIVCVVATVSARLADDHDIFGRRRTAPGVR